MEFFLVFLLINILSLTIRLVMFFFDKVCMNLACYAVNQSPIDKTFKKYFAVSFQQFRGRNTLKSSRML